MFISNFFKMRKPLTACAFVLCGLVAQTSVAFEVYRPVEGSTVQSTFNFVVKTDNGQRPGDLQISTDPSFVTGTTTVAASNWLPMQGWWEIAMHTAPLTVGANYWRTVTQTGFSATHTFTVPTPQIACPADPAVYAPVTIGNDTKPSWLTPMWMHADVTGNPLDHSDGFPQLDEPMIVVNGSLYMPVFKVGVGPGQSLYRFDALTGEYLGIVSIDITAVNTLYKKRRYECLGFDDAGNPFMAAGFNALPENGEYMTEINPNATDFCLAVVPLDFSDPANPRATHKQYKCPVSDMLQKHGAPVYTAIGNIHVHGDIASPQFTVTATTYDRHKDALGQNLSKRYLHHTRWTFNEANNYLPDEGERIYFQEDNSWEPYFDIKMVQAAPDLYWVNSCDYTFRTDEFPNGGPFKVVPRLARVTSDYDTLTIVGKFDPDTEALHTGNAIDCFTLNGHHLMVCASKSENEAGTRFAIVEVPDFPNSLSRARTLWQFPADCMARNFTPEKSWNYETLTSLAVNPGKNAAGEDIADVYCYARGRGLAAYRVQPMLLTNIDDIDGGIDGIVIDNGRISAAGNCKIAIYDVCGRCVLENAHGTIASGCLPAGIYIARAGTASRKFAVQAK